MKRDADSLLSDFNHEIIGPADMTVRRAFGQIVDEAVYTDPGNYFNLREVIDLEFQLAASLERLQGVRSAADIALTANNLPAGFSKSLFVNLSTVRRSPAKHPWIDSAMGELDRSPTINQPYGLGFELKETNSGEPTGSKLFFYGAAITELPKELKPPTLFYLNSTPSEAWRVRTSYSYSRAGFTRVALLPLDPNTDSRPPKSLLSDADIELRAKNSALKSGLKWTNIETPVSVGDLAVVRSGYIIALELLQAEQQRR